MMDSALTRLENLLDRFREPEKLGAEELGVLSQLWSEGVESVVQAGKTIHLQEAQKDQYRIRLQQLIDQLPAIETLLSQHKSEVAQRLYAENRRFKALASSYGGSGRNSMGRTV
ncbi:MAG: hypothetical protein H7832_06700 [Magnetococcus sp. DMHC-6]